MKRRMLISCQIFQRELQPILDQQELAVDVQYLHLGLHRDSAEVALQGIQQAIDSVDPSAFETILIGYGLCNFGIRGLVARELPLVIPRVHDCISLLFGSRKRYVTFFEEHPDSYFLTSGWVDAMEQGELGPNATVTGSQFGFNCELTSLIEKYGEDNGRFLYEQLKPRGYAQHVYLTTQVKDEPALIDQAQQDASGRGCPLKIVEGDTRLLRTLVTGPWAEEHFLVVPPGNQVTVVYDDHLIDRVEA